MVTTTGTAATWNGGFCGTCGAMFLGSHKCSPIDLIRRAEELRELALRRFAEMNPQPTCAPADRSAGCPCRPENGGSGACGCTLGGPQVTC